VRRVSHKYPLALQRSLKALQEVVQCIDERLNVTRNIHITPDALQRFD
jgi:hypothetical protein